MEQRKTEMLHEYSFPVPPHVINPVWTTQGFYLGLYDWKGEISCLSYGIISVLFVWEPLISPTACNNLDD